MALGSVVAIIPAILTVGWLYSRRRRRGRDFKWWEWPVFFIGAQVLWAVILGTAIGAFIGSGTGA